jgi:hypothetical protein
MSITDLIEAVRAARADLRLKIAERARCNAVAYTVAEEAAAAVRAYDQARAALSYALDHEDDPPPVTVVPRDRLGLEAVDGGPAP